MGLYKEMLLQILIEKLNINIEPDIKQMVEERSFAALQKIKTIIDDDSLDDSECFIKIERIIDVFESIGSDGGSRHDFG